MGVIVLWRIPVIYAHFVMNCAQVAHAKSLQRASAGVWDPEPYRKLRDTYEQMSQIDSDWQREPLYVLLPLFISQTPPEQWVSICPGEAYGYLFLRLLKLAESLEQTRKFEQADSLYRILSVQCPESFELFNAWAGFASNQKQYDQAIARLEKAITLDPKLPPSDYGQGDQPKSKWSQIALARASSEIGVQYHNQYQYAKAVETLEASLSKYPPGTISLWLYNLIGVSAFEAGQFAKAKWAFMKVLEKDTNLESEAIQYLKRIDAKKNPPLY